MTKQLTGSFVHVNFEHHDLAKKTINFRSVHKIFFSYPPKKIQNKQKPKGARNRVLVQLKKSLKGFLKGFKRQQFIIF